MFSEPFPQYLLLLGLAVAVVAAFQRLRVPSSLGYLLVGVLLGPHTWGPVVPAEPMGAMADFGLVFLLFTIGLNYSLPQIQSLRSLVLSLGAGQVALTTVAVGGAAWLAGFPPAAAFVAGAVFAQTSTTILGKQLSEQSEEHSPHGRTALAISVFQDVTAVPFLVVIPLLGAAVGLGALSATLGVAAVKAVAAFGLVYAAGRWLFRPLFYWVSRAHSIELFTLAVLFVSLVAGAVTSGLGLSMPFGAFLAGMMLGETEFRHQVEVVIRPFRDVLLGLFFVGVGMLFEPQVIGDLWPWALAGMLVLLVSKVLVVRALTGFAGIDAATAWRTGLLLAAGGEFGLALVALALQGGSIDPARAQIILVSVLFSMVAGALLIRFNEAIGRRLAGKRDPRAESLRPSERPPEVREHVIVCGYGRIGQNVARFLEEEQIAYVAVDLEPDRVKQARAAGEPVFYGDAGERGILEACGIAHARLLVVSHEDTASAAKTLEQARALRHDLPIMVRTRDEAHVERLRRAGATEVVPETMEAGLMIASQALLLLKVPPARVWQRMEQVRASHYAVMREFFADAGDEHGDEALRPVAVPKDGAVVGVTIADARLTGVAVSALVRGHRRRVQPPETTRIEPGDVLVLWGRPEALEHAQRIIERRSIS